MVNGAKCSGTNTKTCGEIDGFSCLTQAGCRFDWDPPCERDPFDVAITPLDSDTVVCDEGGNLAAQRGGCLKTRPSRDGETTFSFSVAVAGCQTSAVDPDCRTFSGCAVSIDGRDCQCCSMCEPGTLRASFNCANVLSLARVEGDEWCPEGTRCVGHDCAGDCVCGAAGGGPGSAAVQQIRGGASLRAFFVVVVVPAVVAALVVASAVWD